MSEWEERHKLSTRIRKDFWVCVTENIKEYLIFYAIILFLLSIDLFFRYYTYWCNTC